MRSKLQTVQVYGGSKRDQGQEGRNKEDPEQGELQDGRSHLWDLVQAMSESHLCRKDTELSDG